MARKHDFYASRQVASGGVTGITGAGATAVTGLKAFQIIPLDDVEITEVTVKKDTDAAAVVTTGYEGWTIPANSIITFDGVLTSIKCSAVNILCYDEDDDFLGENYTHTNA